ncbi:MAG: SufS family cysteine desulfurase [Cyclobacteriaceae bacterium]|nr:SufS family cysteine desulfurase [Cyclobacteriaceae bacterium]
MLDVSLIRKQFPIFSTVNDAGKPLVYLDNAATTQKPWVVLESLSNYYRTLNANIHRGIYDLADKSTKAYEQSRGKVAQFLKVEHLEEIIFCRGTTEAINMVAHGWGMDHLNPGDEVLVTAMEHHANFVPWQVACEYSGAKFKVLPLNSDGSLNLESLKEALTPHTRMLAVTHISNTLGCINPIQEIVKIAHNNGTLVMVDGAQSVSFQELNLQDLDCDFFAFSGHKIFGPMGVGVLYGKRELLQEMSPYQQGGSMIYQVGEQKTTYKAPPHRFEAGTPPVADAVALGTALDFVNGIGLASIKDHHIQLRNYAWERLTTTDHVQLLGSPNQSAGIISFNVENIHAHDVATILGEAGIAVRAGHHCTQPLMDHLGISGTVRVSFSIYNDFNEVDQLIDALVTTRKIMA